ncbi:MAG: hypothetical protein J1F64_10760 [Oscillospiraceae bacterium]|nr:hypothetical protein [Oscillospiraceae bacterium]
MKKILICSFITALIVALSSCDGNNTEIKPSNTPEATDLSSTPAQTEYIPEESAGPADENKSGSVIKPGDKTDLSGMTKTYSGSFDFNSDDIIDNVSLYIDAQKDENGILMLEDSNKWTLVVSDGITSYTLFDSTVSHGSLYVEISEYYKNDTAIPTLSLIKDSGAGLSITNYTYNKNAGGFDKSEVFSTDSLSDGGINKISSSLPDPEAVNN